MYEFYRFASSFSFVSKALLAVCFISCFLYLPPHFMLKAFYACKYKPTIHAHNCQTPGNGEMVEEIAYYKKLVLLHNFKVFAISLLHVYRQAAFSTLVWIVLYKYHFT